VGDCRKRPFIDGNKIENEARIICHGTVGSNIDEIVKSWFMPRVAAYEVRRGAEPDTLFQTFSKDFGGDGRRFGAQRYVIEARGAWEV